MDRTPAQGYGARPRRHGVNDMLQLSSFLEGSWVRGAGEGAVLTAAATGLGFANANADGLDRGRALAWARERGGANLRAMTFAERAALIKALGKALHAHRDELLDLSTASYGATRGDGKFDVDGASGTLAYYAALGATLGDRTTLLDGDLEPVGRSARFAGQHVRVARRGVAVHINAFNFPAWGMCEKLAVSLLAGVPALVKPAVATAPVAWRIVQIWSEQGLLPEGAVSLLVGSVGDLLDHLGPQDVIAFTGSGATARAIRGHARVLELGVPVNVEADSLNAAVLGPDASDETFDMFLADVGRDLTQKAGQKCTAIRRVLVPEDRVDEVCEALADTLSRVQLAPEGDAHTLVGPLSTAAQQRDITAGIAALATACDVGVAPSAEVPSAGFYVAPRVFVARTPEARAAVHAGEVFGPVTTILPYDGEADTAIALVAQGGGELVASLYAEDPAWAGEVIAGIAPWTGRVYWGSRKIADQGVGPGTVLPAFVHGGPGMAGGGQELGGLRGLDLYLHRVAVQGDRGLLDRALAR